MLFILLQSKVEQSTTCHE